MENDCGHCSYTYHSLSRDAATLSATQSANAIRAGSKDGCEGSTWTVSAHMHGTVVICAVITATTQHSLNACMWLPK
jgi:hypothetical protein